jgi:hypothetical protein
MWLNLFRKIIKSKQTTNKDNRLLEITLQKNLEVMGNLNMQMGSFSGRLSTLQKDIHMLDQKFDLLTDMFGIEIAADCINQPPTPFVKSKRDNSFILSAKKYIDAAVTAEKILATQYKMFEQANEFMKTIKWR